MGGKPSRGTKADRRLKANRSTSTTPSANSAVPHMPADMTHPSMARDGMPKGMPMPGRQAPGR